MFKSVPGLTSLACLGKSRPSLYFDLSSFTLGFLVSGPKETSNSPPWANGRGDANIPQVEYCYSAPTAGSLLKLLQRV